MDMRTQGETVRAKASTEDGLNNIFNKQPRNHPQHRREVMPGSSGMRNEKLSRRRPNILGRENYSYVSSTIGNY